MSNDNTVTALSFSVKREQNPVVRGQSERKGWRDESMTVRGETEIRARERTKNVDTRRRKKEKKYLLPSIRLPGRGLPLNMAAAHPKGRGL